MVNKSKGRPSNKRIKALHEKKQSSKKKSRIDISKEVKNQVQQQDIQIQQQGIQIQHHEKIQVQQHEKIQVQQQEMQMQQQVIQKELVQEEMQQQFHCPSPPSYKYSNLQHFSFFNENESLEQGI